MASPRSNKGNYPVARPSPRNDRQRLLVLAFAGFGVSLVLIAVILISISGRVDARPSTDSDGALPSAATTTLGTVALLTPEQEVKPGDVLGEVKWKSIFWPRNNVPDGAIRDVSELAGKYAKTSIAQGQPVLRAFLSDQPPIRQGLKPISGNRAVSIECDETGCIEGFTSPGVRVDVVLTSRTEEQRMLNSRIIVANARVLSYGGIKEGGAAEVRMPGQRTVVARTVTLDVSVKDALELATGSGIGKMRLILRHRDDNLTPSVIEHNEAELRGIAKKVNQAAPSANCKRGMNIGDQEFMICDGKMYPVDAN